ncbi:MAG TPA: hypothetical protein V6D08_04210 [Candidatus Obscuribacterales bacterium]
MRADFERMRDQHRQQFSPQGREFLRKMDQRYQQQEYNQQAAAQAQIRAAANMPAGVTPSACALAYEQALRDATRYDQIRPFFTEHYYNVYVGRKSPAEQQKELAAMKQDYVFDCKVRGQDKIDADGHADVWLEGFDANGKGCWVNLRMIPEANYWKIDGYRGQTGLNVIYIPKNIGPKVPKDINLGLPKNISPSFTVPGQK